MGKIILEEIGWLELKGFVVRNEDGKVFDELRFVEELNREGKVHVEYSPCDNMDSIGFDISPLGCDVALHKLALKYSNDRAEKCGGDFEDRTRFSSRNYF